MSGRRVTFAVVALAVFGGALAGEPIPRASQVTGNGFGSDKPRPNAPIESSPILPSEPSSLFNISGDDLSENYHSFRSQLRLIDRNRDRSLTMSDYADEEQNDVAQPAVLGVLIVGASYLFIWTVWMILIWRQSRDRRSSA